MERHQMQDTRDLVTVTIAADTDIVEVPDLHNHRLIAIQMSADWTAGDMTFETSVDGAAGYVDVRESDDTVFTITPTASHYYAFSDVEQKMMNSIRFMKVKSSVKQLADRELVLVTAPMK